MKNKFMAAVAVVAVLTATGAARAETNDIAALKAQSAALKKQNAALEARLNKLEKQQQAAAAQQATAAQQAANRPATTSFMAADLPSIKGLPSLCAPLTPEGPLTFCGITIFGTIDAGLGYASSGLPINGKLYLGDELVNKFAHAGYFGVNPNGLSVSTLGVKGSEEILPGWSGVFQASTNINPQSGQLANAPGSIIDNNGLNRNNFSNLGDGSRGGQAFNDQLFVGVSSKDFGTLTFGRQKTLLYDMIVAYDPAGGAAAYSLLGYAGTYGVGMGNTENGRWDDAFKYRVEYGPGRFGAMYKFADGNGGSNVGFGGAACTGTNLPVSGCAKPTLTGTQNYSAQNDAAQFTLGGSYGGLDVDGVLGYYHQSTLVSTPLSPAQLGGISTFTSNTGFVTTSSGNVNGGTLAGTAADITGGAIAAKYTWNQFKFFAGWEHDIFHNPANNVGIGAQNDQGGYVLSTITNAGYPHARLLDVEWAGVRYAYDIQTDIAVSYYHAGQNGYGTAANLATCGEAGYIRATQASPRSATCSGTLDAVSAFVDYHFTKRFDVYGGMMYSVVGGGIASGYYNVNNWAPTAGARFTF